MYRCAAIVVVIVALGALGRLASFEFTVWDDHHTITENPHVNPPSLTGLKYHWTHPYGELYVPITYTCWIALGWLGQIPNQTGAAGLNPWLFHSANLLIHLCSALLVLSILRRLSFAPFAACIGSFVFAVHPVQVEAVAWISGLKDVLSGAFCLLAIDQYLAAHFEDRQRKSRALFRYWLSVLAFILAMLSKPTAIALPLILLVIDVLLLRRKIAVVARSLVPFVILAIPCLVWSKLFQPAHLLSGPYPFWWRPFIAGHALAVYLWTLTWPWNLGIDYGLSPTNVMAGRMWMFAWIVPMLLVVILVWRKAPEQVIAGLLVFLVALLPMLGFVPFEFQNKSTVADHYLYLPMLGIAIVVASLFSGPARGARAVVGANLVAALASCTFVQAGHWRHSLALFQRAVSINPDSTVAHNNLFVLAEAAGDASAAEYHARRALALQPDEMWSQVHLGDALAMQGRYDEAAEIFRVAIDRFPDRAQPHLALAAALMDLNRPAEALAEYDRVGQMAPNMPGLEHLRERARNALRSTNPTPP